MTKANFELFYFAMKGLPNCEILKQIEQGYRMPLPNLPPHGSPCPENLYELMLQCWSINKNERPSFEYMQVSNIEVVCEM